MTSTNSSENLSYLKGLHGLRFFAAFLVVIFHCHDSLLQINTKYWITWEIFQKGHTAVDFFFILSGFLLTFLACREYTKNQKIDIKSFYKRRALRILPLYYLAVAMGFILTGIIYPLFIGEKFITFPIGEGLFYYLIFLPNWVLVKWQQVGPTLSLWSIGVEEQFYLLFPLIVFLPLKRRFLLFSILAWLFGYSAFYFANSYGHLGFDGLVHQFIEFTLRFHFLLWGCLLGYLYFYYRPWFEKVFGHIIFQIAAIALLGFMMTVKAPDQDYYHLISGFSFSLIMIIVTLPQSVIKLEWQPVKYLGIISYGIYIFHPFVSIGFRFLMQKSKSFDHFILTNSWAFYVLVFMITIAIAHFSYKYYESYFLRKK